MQVYKIENRKRVIVRHTGTARNEQEKLDLLTLANDFIDNKSQQPQILVALMVTKEGFPIA